MTAETANTSPTVLVLYGGQSSEHAVSCVTAAGVLGALDQTSYRTVEVGITAEGQWTRPAVDPRTHSFADPDVLPRVEPTESSVMLHPGAGGNSQRGAQLIEVHPDGQTQVLAEVDVLLPLLHGPHGEDGTLQGLLEVIGLPYVGAGVLASAVAMDKHFTKMVFHDAGLKVGPWETLTARQWALDPQSCVQRVKKLELPVYVKPARAGSSMGITRVESWDQLEEALAEAQKHDPKVVVEQGIDGREIECGVLGSAGTAAPRASKLGEIVVRGGEDAHAFYDFTAKYTEAGASELSCPAELPTEVTAEIQSQALRAFEALDAEGLSRVDFFYTTDGQILINEVNTMPGFTPTSMYPQVWKSSGLEFNDLITELIELALQRPVGLR